MPRDRDDRRRRGFGQVGCRKAGRREAGPPLYRQRPHVPCGHPPGNRARYLPHDADVVTTLAESTRMRIEGERVWADGHELTEGIYDTDYADALPIISAIPGVRKSLVEQQRQLGESGVVMAGRDIGTVVFPDADHKFFLIASLDEKVRRRAAQYERRGERVDEEAMRKEVEMRDRVDSERPVAPLRPAADAVIIDTDHLDLDQVVERILETVRQRR